MKLTIDNLDGRGAMDYSAAVDGSEPLTIARTLNAPSTLKGMLCLEGSALPVPARRGRVEVSSDAGTLLFTGYLTVEPVAVYAGAASQGAVYRQAISAVSDEWLLDKQAPGTAVGVGLGSFSGDLLKSLLGRLDTGLFNTAGIQSGQRIGVFAPESAAAWSAHAGAAANATYAAYRVLNGAVTLAPAGTATHSLSDGDGSLQVAALRTARVRELANDVTLSGAMEPATYWTEIFLGDGTTTTFDLSGEPDAPNAGHAVLLDDTFAGSAFNPQVWSLTDPGSHLAPGVGGLLLSGGNGFDGQTTLAAIDPVEMGGSVVVELDNVMLSAGSAGILGGLYSGAITQPDCVAGFNVRQSGGNTLLVPLLNGAEAGAPFIVVSGHAYTLRLRMHCAEMLRVKQAFYAMTEASGALAVTQFGGGDTDAPAAFVFEVRDTGASSNTPVTVLYDGSVASSVASATFAAVNSLQLFGSIGAVEVSRSGSGWVQSTDPASGTVSTRLIGRSSDGVDCTLTSSVTGHVTFFPGRVPLAAEYVTVSYRGRSRAVARLADAASLAAEAAGGSVGTARWLGHVAQPVARSSEDCEFAAQAVLAFATNRAAAVSGSYAAVNPETATGDIWPGDVLALTANGSSTNAIVRRVTLESGGASPEAVRYGIAFANDWAEGLGISFSEAIAKDALLPETALELAPGQTPGNPAHVLANLQQMTVTAFTGTGASDALSVDAGLAPPAGGGFEVRRSDGGWGTGLGGGAAATGSADLVLRSPVRGFSIPRAAMDETFYVRMYDASTPPLYSRFASAIATHVPLP